MSIQIPGLPEGVEAIRFGQCGPEDFELTNDQGCGIQITKGERPGSTTQVIVRPAPDYEFVLDKRTLNFKAVKKLERPLEIVRTLHFWVSNQVDQDLVEERLDALRELPGYTE